MNYIKLLTNKNIKILKKCKMSTPKKQSKLILFKELCGYKEGTISRIVNVNEFEGKYGCLKFNNGGNWCRTSVLHGLKFIRIQQNGKINYSNCSPTDQIFISKYINEKKINGDIIFNKGNSIKYIFIYGQKEKNDNRPISQKVRTHYADKPCVVCGSNSNIVIDHKNDLYNDERVLNTDTQTVEDFQPLCIHCNLQKRQVNKKMRETGKRYSALLIPSVAVFGVDFTSGDETFNETDPNWGVGSYWYDPVAFVRDAMMKLKRDDIDNTISNQLKNLKL